MTGPGDLLVELDADPAADPAAELAADALWQAGATALEIRDGPGSPVTTVVASFPTAVAARTVATELAERGARLVEVAPGEQEVWRRFAEAVPVGRGLVVAPAWRDVPVPSGRIVVRIDPGPCFGSGTHASTRMVLAALDRRPPGDGSSVLDAGCGSGILAVTAALLGAGHVRAVDVDPDAVSATEANAAANGVGARIEATTAPLGALAGPYDLAVVNVTAAVHVLLGPEVVRLVRPGGRILVAGLLPGQWRHVEPSYRGAAIVADMELAGWVGAELVVGVPPAVRGGASEKAAQRQNAGTRLTDSR
ncbi:MAG TPA: 50S ribosomal protein L11 methyltransferase [Acidimicrobiales bacterium]|nr:50S ribosomal protein L11 methyltransferase [Acidimicrobiales bacterium]